MVVKEGNILKPTIITKGITTIPGYISGRAMGRHRDERHLS